MSSAPHNLSSRGIIQTGNVSAYCQAHRFCRRKNTLTLVNKKSIKPKPTCSVCLQMLVFILIILIPLGHEWRERLWMTATSRCPDHRALWEHDLRCVSVHGSAPDSELDHNSRRPAPAVDCRNAERSQGSCGKHRPGNCTDNGTTSQLLYIRINCTLTFCTIMDNLFIADM